MTLTRTCPLTLRTLSLNPCIKLFGEDDPDQDVSPDTADPEAEGDKVGEDASNKEANQVM